MPGQLLAPGEFKIRRRKKSGRYLFSVEIRQREILTGRPPRVHRRAQIAVERQTMEAHLADGPIQFQLGPVDFDANAMQADQVAGRQNHRHLALGRGKDRRPDVAARGARQAVVHQFQVDFKA